MKQTLTLHVVGVAASSMSLILIHQLEDKLKAHDLYLCFLKNVDLWSRVCRSVCVIRAGLWTFKCYYFACLSRLLPGASVRGATPSEIWWWVQKGWSWVILLCSGQCFEFPFSALTLLAAIVIWSVSTWASYPQQRFYFWNRETNQWRIG